MSSESDSPVQHTSSPDSDYDPNGDGYVDHMLPDGECGRTDEATARYDDGDAVDHPSCIKQDPLRPPPMVSPAADVNRPGTGEHRALIVDDDPGCRALVAVTLTTAGWTTTEVGTLAGAIDERLDEVNRVREIRAQSRPRVVPELTSVDSGLLRIRNGEPDQTVMDSPLEDAVVVPPPPLPKGWRLVVAHRGPVADAAARLEYEIFRSEGFCVPSAHRVVEEYAPWAHSSVFHTVIDQDDTAVGVVRTIVGDLETLPVGKLDRTGRPSPDPVCEYASLAVAPHARKSGVAEALYRSVWVQARASGAKALVAILEPWLHELLRDHYGFAFEPFGPLVWYMGGDVVPVGAEMNALERRLAAERPLLWAWICEAAPVAAATS